MDNKYIHACEYAQAHTRPSARKYPGGKLIRQTRAWPHQVASGRPHRQRKCKHLRARTALSIDDETGLGRKNPKFGNVCEMPETHVVQPLNLMLHCGQNNKRNF